MGEIGEGAGVRLAPLDLVGELDMPTPGSHRPNAGTVHTRVKSQRERERESHTDTDTQRARDITHEYKVGLE